MNKAADLRAQAENKWHMAMRINTCNRPAPSEVQRARRTVAGSHCAFSRALRLSLAAPLHPSAFGLLKKFTGAHYDVGRERVQFGIDGL